MSDPLPTPDPEERPPWWFRRLPKGLQMWVALFALNHVMKKLMKDPELPAKIEQMGGLWERGMQILQGKEEKEP